jgi:hypothetical protein
VPPPRRLVAQGEPGWGEVLVVKVRARTVVQGRVRVRVRVGAKVRAAQQRMWCAGEGRRALTGTTLDSAAAEAVGGTG